MIEQLDAALVGIAWEVVYVDDNSPDGTTAEVRRIAQTDPRVRCIRRIGRRGLASAVIEGALSSSAHFVAVIDGDLQHDETKLPHMLAALRTGRYDIAVGSRHVKGGDASGLTNRWRHVLSDGGIWLAQLFLPVRLTDPMSGYFMLPRPLFEELAAGLNGQGFKILVDLVLSSPAPLRVIEIPFRIPRARCRREQAGRAGADAVRRPVAGQGVRRAAAASLHLLRTGGRAGRGGAPCGADGGAEVRRAGLRSGTGDRHSGCDRLQFPAQQ